MQLCKKDNKILIRKNVDTTGGTSVHFLYHGW